MKKVTLGDKHFKLFIESKKILAEIDQLSLKINEHYANKRPIFICVLNGAFLFSTCNLEILKLLVYTVRS